jgi:hypothetical protein
MSRLPRAWLQSVEEWGERHYGTLADPREQLPQDVGDGYVPPIVTHLYGLRRGAYTLHIHYRLQLDSVGEGDGCVVCDCSGPDTGGVGHVPLGGLDGYLATVPFGNVIPNRGTGEAGDVDMEIPVAVFVGETVEQVKWMELRLVPLRIDRLQLLDECDCLGFHLAGADIPLIASSGERLVFLLDKRDFPNLFAHDGEHNVRPLGTRIEGASEVVERRPKVVENVANYQSPGGIGALRELQDPRTLCIALNEFAGSIGVAVPELSHGRFQFLQTLLRPTQLPQEVGDFKFRRHSLPLEEDVGGGDRTHGHTPYEASPDGAR